MFQVRQELPHPVPLLHSSRQRGPELLEKRLLLILRDYLGGVGHGGELFLDGVEGQRMRGRRYGPYRNRRRGDGAAGNRNYLEGGHGITPPFPPSVGRCSTAGHRESGCGPTFAAQTRRGRYL